jgi:hypothetical protein
LKKFLEKSVTEIGNAGSLWFSVLAVWAF